VAEARKDTRAAIIEAAMRGFAERGFAATSTREIAASAGTNIASISYHFGSKEGLRSACAEHVVELMRGAIQLPEPPPTPPSPEAARRILIELVGRLARFLLLRPEAGLVAGFVLREMGQPSEALDIVYGGVFEMVHRRLCSLWGIATGRDPESEEVRIAVFGVIGQVAYFHVARPVVMRRMGWNGIGPAEARAIAETVTRTIEARLAADCERDR
jgi:AcrR family transcriptional regulator